MSPPIDRLGYLIDAGRYDTALQESHRLLSQEPHNAELWEVVLRAEIGLERPDRALEAAHRLASIAPDSVLAHIGASIALNAQKRRLEALGAARRAIEVDPHNLYAHVQFAEVASQLKGHGELAWRAATHAVELAPNTAAAHAVMGLVAMRADRPDVADQALRRALELDPTNHAAQHNLGLVRIGRGELVQGTVDLGVSAAADPNSRESAYAFRVVVLRWLQRTHLGMWGFWILARVWSVDAETYWATRVVTLLGAAFLFWWSRRTVLQLAGHLRRALWLVTRRSVPTLIWFWSVVIAGVAFALAGLAPNPGFGQTCLIVTGFGLLVGCLASWIGVALSRRS